MNRVALVTNLPAHYRTPLFERFADRADVDFYFTSKGVEWYWPPASTLSTGTLRAARITDARDLGATLARGRYDCIVTSLVGRATLLATILAAKATRTPLVVWVGIWAHPKTPFHSISRPAARWAYRNADAVLVYGEHVRRFIAAESGRVDNVIVLPQAVDNERFREHVPAGRVASLRADLAGGGGACGCYVGRLDEGKGLRTLVRALATTKVDQSFAFVGQGKLQPQLEELAASLGIADRVRFLGYVSQENLPALLRAADYLALPSVTTPRFKECWGLVVNEAMNVGVPVIATDAVGAVAGGLVIDGQTGLVVPERNAAALAAALDEMAGSGALRARLAERAREHVLAWNFDAGVEALLAGVASAVGRKGTRVADPARA